MNLRIYDASGRLVRTLLSGENMSAGRREAVWRGRNEAGAPVATGVYYYRLDTRGHVETRPMVLLK